MADESYPAELRYSKDHAWARIDGETAVFGITWFAQDSLKEIVHFSPPTVGDHVSQGQPYCDIESVKAVSDVYAPLSGEVIQVNTALQSGAVRINEDPYGQGWLVEVKIADRGEAGVLLSAEEYRATITA
jgi:glycine cleavage system H protein